MFPGTYQSPSTTASFPASFPRPSSFSLAYCGPSASNPPQYPAYVATSGGCHVAYPISLPYPFNFLHPLHRIRSGTCASTCRDVTFSTVFYPRRTARSSRSCPTLFFYMSYQLHVFRVCFTPLQSPSNRRVSLPPSPRPTSPSLISPPASLTRSLMWLPRVSCPTRTSRSGKQRTWAWATRQ